MNQIYKVIWSRVKHCYVVVSEISGRCGKNGGAASEKKSLPFRAFLCALVLTGCLMPGWRKRTHSMVRVLPLPAVTAWR